MSAARRLPISQVDAFADRPFAGNPAAGYIGQYARVGQFTPEGSRPGAMAAAAYVSQRVLPLVEKVARKLALHPGQITVTGYTDNQPIRSIRFPSNWQLSAERAEHVGQRIATFLPNTAIATEGAGAANPIAPNDSAQGRARNRRVEIMLIHNQ